MFRNLNVGMIGVNATLPEAIAYAKGSGFQGIDVKIGEIKELADAHGINYMRTIFDEAGIVPGSWGFPVDFRGDEAVWREGLESLPEQARLAREIGCFRTATWISPGDDERDFQTNFAFHVKRLRPAAEILKEYGCSLGLEFVGPQTSRAQRKYGFLHTLDGMRALGAGIGTGNVGILLDIWHLYSSHGTLAEMSELVKEDIVVVHVNDAPAGIPVDEQIDNIRTLPGETGVLDIVGFLKTLHSIGYDGPVTAEPFSARVRSLPADVAVGETGAAMQKVWQAAGLS